jgi:Family of unknown function (DUF5681)
VPADGPRDYEIGYKKPPVATRFKKGNRANPHGRPRGSKNLAALLEHALDQAADADPSERRDRLTKRELVVARLVERSAGADLAATKLLFELLRKIDPRMVTAPSDPIGVSPIDDPIAQVRAKLLRLAQARGLVPPSDTPPAAPAPPANPDRTAPDPSDPGTTPDDDPIAQVSVKLQRLAQARGLVSAPDASHAADPPAASADASDPVDAATGMD